MKDIESRRKQRTDKNIWSNSYIFDLGRISGILKYNNRDNGDFSRDNGDF